MIDGLLGIGATVTGIIIGFIAGNCIGLLLGIVGRLIHHD